LAAFAAREDRSGVSVGDDEVKAVMDKMNASKATEISRRRNLPFGHSLYRGADARKRQQDPDAVARWSLLRRLRPAVFGSLYRGGRRRPWLGPARTASSGNRGYDETNAGGLDQHGISVPGGFSIISVQDTRKI
jgi:hypothetical protein